MCRVEVNVWENFCIFAKTNENNMSWNPYKDYYDAMNSNSEWSGVDAEKARRRIKDLEEEASWNGYSVDALLRARQDEWKDMGS